MISTVPNYWPFKTKFPWNHLQLDKSTCSKPFCQNCSKFVLFAFLVDFILFPLHFRLLIGNGSRERVPTSRRPYSLCSETGNRKNPHKKDIHIHVCYWKWFTKRMRPPHHCHPSYPFPEAYYTGCSKSPATK